MIASALIYRYSKKSRTTLKLWKKAYFKGINPYYYYYYYFQNEGNKRTLGFLAQICFKKAVRLLPNCR